MAELVRRIVDGEAVSPAADLEMHRLLTRTHWDDEAVSAIPPSIQVASKQGVVSRSRGEVAYVHAPSGPYVFTVVTREQGDTRFAPDNAGYELIRAVSRLLWTTFEPSSDWRPPPGSERFRL
jgi:beta-lactamase class A